MVHIINNEAVFIDKDLVLVALAKAQALVKRFEEAGQTEEQATASAIEMIELSDDCESCSASIDYHLEHGDH